MGVGVWVVEEEAEIGEVCGSLGWLRKGLKSHEGASLDARVALGAAIWDVRVVEDDAERLERSDMIEDWEGDLLTPLNVTAPVFNMPGECSGGRSRELRFGLSSIGSIFPAVEVLCRGRVSGSRCVIPVEELLVVEATESRMLTSLDSGRRAKISISNLSASICDKRLSSTTS